MKAFEVRTDRVINQYFDFPVNNILSRCLPFLTESWLYFSIRVQLSLQLIPLTLRLLAQPINKVVSSFQDKLQR